MGRLPDDVAFDLGLHVRVGRFRSGLTQAEVAERAATSSSTVSRLELGRGAGVPLRVWVDVGDAVGADLFARPSDRASIYADALSRLAEDGGWAVTYRGDSVIWIDRPAHAVRFVRTVLRPAERAVVRIIPVLTHLDWERARLAESVREARAVGPPGMAIEGLLVIVRTSENIRRAGSSWRTSSFGWSSAIRDASVRMPPRSGLAWLDRRGTHLLPAA